MNREIKFRAWTGTEMFLSMNQDLYGLSTWFEAHSSIRNNNDSIIMQYTGLKDKNGKEIYEGDIIKRKIQNFIGIDLELAVNKIKIDYEKDVVKYSGSCFIAFKNPLHRIINFEVIGNIYENPELLKP